MSITNVHITNKLLPDYRLFKVTKVDYSSKGAWHRIGNGSSITVKPGAKVKLRLTFGRGDTTTDVAPKTRIVTWNVSPGARKSGSLVLTGNADHSDDEENFDEKLAGYFDAYEPASLDELLDVMASEPRNDDLGYLMSYWTKSGNRFAKPGSLRAPGVITGKHTVKLVIR